MINSIIYFEEKCIHKFIKLEKEINLFSRLTLTHKHSHKILYIIVYWF